MTITVAYTVLSYNCNGSVTSFSVTWPFFLSSDLVVTHIDADGVETVLTLTTNYTVSGGRDSSTGLPGTGTVTTVSTYASGHKIRVSRATPKTQQTAITTSGAFPAKTVEAMIDRVHMIAEEGGMGGATADIDGAALRLETSGETDYWDGEDYIARGFADGVNDDDLATVGQLGPFVDDAEAAAAAAAASASAASTSASGASTSASAASTSASAASTSASSAATQASAASTSATNAATSASAASTSATNAATSATEATAAAGFSFTYSTTTTMADPGSGAVRFNHATLASVTAIAIDDLSADTGTPDVSGWVGTFDDSSNTTKGTLRLRKKTAPQNFVDYIITGATDNSGWTQLAVTHSTSQGSLTNADSLLVAFYATGDQGPSGSGAGNVTGPASAADGEIVLYDGATGKLLKRASTTGLLKATSGVLAAAVASTDYAPATSGAAILKGNGSGGFSAAVSATDYAPATSGSALLKGNGAGGFSSAVSSTDYAPATSGSSVLKGNGAGGFSAATANTDYIATTRSISTSTGLTGGGDLSANRTLSLDVTGLTAETAPATADEILIYDASAAAQRKMTLENALKVINSLTEDTSPDTSADFLLSYDTSASAVKKVKPTNIASSQWVELSDTTISGAVANVEVTWTAGTYAIIQVIISDVSCSAATPATLTTTLRHSGAAIVTANMDTSADAVGDVVTGIVEFSIGLDASTKRHNGRVSYSSATSGGTANAAGTSATAPDRIRVAYSTGNIDDGRIIVKGLIH